MITIILLLKRKKGISREEFRNYYELIHVPLGKKYLGHLFHDYKRHYVDSSFGITDDRVETAMLQESSCDAITSIVLRDQAALDEFWRIAQTPAIAAELTADEARFLDRRAMKIQICEEVKTWVAADLKRGTAELPATALFSGVHHASITTRNIERLKDFYCRFLDFEVVLDTSWEAGNELADQIYGLRSTAVKMSMLRQKSTCLELFEFIQPPGKPLDPARPVCDAGYTHLCIVVTDIAAAYERLSAMGMQFNCPPQHQPGLCSATYGRDPDGNLIELMQPAAGGLFDLSAA